MPKSDAGGVVDQLAFGKAAAKTAPCLGLYLSPEVVYIAETHLDKAGQIVVDHLVRIPVPAPDKPATGPAATGTLNTDFLADNTKLSALIFQSMSSIRWNSKEVMVTLSHHLGLLRYFTMPGIDRRFWTNAVPLEAKKYIPIPFDALSHDFQIVSLPPDASNRPRQGALICVTQRKNLANINALVESLGLKMLGLEVAPCSVLRMWESMDKDRGGKTHCQVHFDGGNVRILLADHGLPVFFRELFLGKEAQLGDLRKVDLGGCVGFSQKQLAVGQLEKLLVSGGIPALAQWQQAFSQELGVAASVQDTPQRLGLKGGDWGGYAAIGASLRQVAPTATTLDLGQIGRVSEEERRTARNIFMAAGALSLFFGVIGLYRSVLYHYKVGELTQYRREPEIEAVFSGKAASDVETMLREMNAQAQAAAAVSEDSIQTTALISDIVNALPENTWITSLKLRSPINRANQERLELELVGRAVGPTMAHEQDLAFQFRERLVKTPVLGKHFPDIQVSVTGKPIDVQQTSGDPGAFREMIEERTTFNVVMKKRS